MNNLFPFTVKGRVRNALHLYLLVLGMVLSNAACLAVYTATVLLVWKEVF